VLARTLPPRSPPSSPPLPSPSPSLPPTSLWPSPPLALRTTPCWHFAALPKQPSPSPDCHRLHHRSHRWVCCLCHRGHRLCLYRRRHRLPHRHPHISTGAAVTVSHDPRRALASTAGTNSPSLPPPSSLSPSAPSQPPSPSPSSLPPSPPPPPLSPRWRHRCRRPRATIDAGRPCNRRRYGACIRARYAARTRDP
jgi:hypothetical protein